MNEITVDNIEQLLKLFIKGQYDASKTGEQNCEIHKKCQELFEKDYICSIIHNSEGKLSPNYPLKIIVPFEERYPVPKDVDILNRSPDGTKRKFNALEYRNIVSKSNVARCRTRFPAPVIFFEGKFLCRSATLACTHEMIYRQGNMTGLFNSVTSDTETSSAYCTDKRSQDIKLLNELAVNNICDLMVENKKVKFWLTVSSSEKIDKEKRYNEFKIVQLPYPGCEFFKKFKDANYVAEGLNFNWEQDHVVSLILPNGSVALALDIKWPDYKEWDIVRLTQNYLKLLITYMIKETSGILIHCISGWDRTPLFVSLLRMTLWADGRIHKSLSAVEMAYLTLAYDWYLFGHDLPSRLKVGEEILFFCFEFLKFITSEEYSANEKGRKISSNCTDTPLDILIEEGSPEKSPSNSISIPLKSENASTSIFYASLDNHQDVYSSTMFYSCIDSLDDTDSIKSGKLNSQNDALTDSDYPPTLVNSVESLSNNNGLSSSSSPVPVPSTRQRFDSLSSLGSWQYVSGTGSLLGSVTSKSSSAEVNSNSSNSSSHQENGNFGVSPLTMSGSLERAERLISVRTIMHKAYRKIIGNKDTTNGSYFSWRR